jgi:crossover junction endodeoxyribonuclease RuvC
MIILGIDPGTATTGFALIKKLTNNKYEVVDFGVISTDKNLSDAERLKIISTDLKEIIKKYKPERAGVEKLFFTNNQKTAITVSQARGAILLAIEEEKIPLHEFTPLQVKSTICGYGSASKKQVQYMIKHTFKLKEIPKPDDAADALAIALCASLAR